ncbi:MAG: hypothetical protein J7527_14695, partial [Chitinophagaceae bacterium]|nr:hypothetical protein [Chitinophagaceae bacterium]
MFFCLVILPLLSSAQLYRSHEVKPGQLSIHLTEGEMTLRPLSDKAIRVQWEKNGSKEEQQFVLNASLKTPAFKVTDEGSK